MRAFYRRWGGGAAGLCAVRPEDQPEGTGGLVKIKYRRETAGERASARCFNDQIFEVYQVIETIIRRKIGFEISNVVCKRKCRQATSKMNIEHIALAHVAVQPLIILTTHGSLSSRVSVLRSFDLPHVSAPADGVIAKTCCQWACWSPLTSSTRSPH